MPIITIGLNSTDTYSGFIDNAILSDFPNGADPNSTEIQIVGNGTNPTRAALVKPNIAAALSVLTGATINSAQYEFKRSGGFIGGTMTGRLRRLLRAWVEAEADWTIWSTGNSWTTGGAQGNGTDRDSSDISTATLSDTSDEIVIFTGLGPWVSDVANSIVVNNGHSFFTPEGADWRFHTGQAADGDRPRLRIDYTAAAVGASLAWLRA